MQPTKAILVSCGTREVAHATVRVGWVRERL